MINTQIFQSYLDNKRQEEVDNGNADDEQTKQIWRW